MSLPLGRPLGFIPEGLVFIRGTMSALGHEQTLASELGMSALPLKADIHQPGSHGWSGAEA